jgi:arylsulfatase A
MRTLRSRFTGLLLILLVTGLGSAGTGRSSAQRLPNFIIVYADDMGYADIAPFSTKTGAARPQTPNLDRMASEGIRLTDF